VQTLPIETIALVEATAPDVLAQAAAITFRMWHDLPSDAARRLLFAEYVLDGRIIGLIDAVIMSARRTWPLTRPRPIVPAEAEDAPSLYAAIEIALLLALNDALGKLATRAVLNAWRQAFRLLTEEPETEEPIVQRGSVMLPPMA
jgi:hemoglobin-like flavoprotein